jgi:hypothetical protein
MILIIGDSNFGNTLNVYGERLSAAVKEKIEFMKNSSNESLKVQLEKAVNAKIIIVGAPLNEIVHRVKTGQKKGRDETIRAVCEEQNRIFNESATLASRLGVIHLMVPAFMRMDPAWMEEKYKLCTYYQRDYVKVKSPWNAGIGNPVDIDKDDLKPDKIHLNDHGMEKLFKILEIDLKKCKENLGEGEVSLSQDWASQVVDEQENRIPTPATPAAQRKRVRQSPDLSEEEEDENVIKKAKKSSAEDKMDKIYDLVKEMKEESKLARTEVQDIKEKLTCNDKKVDDLKGEFESFKEEVVRDNELTAEMREDIDGLENENLKVIVVVRKLKAEEPVPKDNKALRTYVQDLARHLARKVLNDEAAKSVKYAAMLYSYVDPTKKDNKEGLVPPFKICFNTKDAAVAFREKALKMAKAGAARRTFGSDQDAEQMDQDQEQGPGAEQQQQQQRGESNVCQGAYFTYFQTAATRFRVTLMWAVADAVKTKSKQVWVSQGNRPTLQIKEGGKVKSLSFVQTMLEYKEKIPQKTLEDVKKGATKLFAGRLEKTFIVIKD